MFFFFFISDTPRQLYFLHTFTWMLNMFGIFFILAAHEHYSIDVFVAFYITSRLFLYYHTLANNQALMQRDSNRTRIWFPLFSFFESSVDGIVPNEFEPPSLIICNLLLKVKETWGFFRCSLSGRAILLNTNGEMSNSRKKKWKKQIFYINWVKKKKVYRTQTLLIAFLFIMYTIFCNFNNPDNCTIKSVWRLIVLK